MKQAAWNLLLQVGVFPALWGANVPCRPHTRARTGGRIEMHARLTQYLSYSLSWVAQKPGMAGYSIGRLPRLFARFGAVPFTKNKTCKYFFCCGALRCPPSRLACGRRTYKFCCYVRKNKKTKKKKSAERRRLAEQGSAEC